MSREIGYYFALVLRVCMGILHYKASGGEITKYFVNNSFCRKGEVSK